MKPERKSRKLVYMAFIALALLLMSTSVLAIGITPSKRIVNFKAGEKLTYGIDIVNNGHEDLDVVIYPRGEFTKRLKLSRQTVKLASDQESVRINVEFEMPEKIDIAGPHTVDIVAVGSTQISENQKAIVKADVAVISKLVIDVPYPEKYAEARIHVFDTEVGKPVMISVPVFNKGNKIINEAYAKITIVSSDGTKVDEIMTEKRSIKPGQNTKFAVKATKEYFLGEYKAVATIYYDEEQFQVETKFSIGEVTIEVRGLVVNEFTLGEVAKFDILLQNSWSQQLRNVYAEMKITGEDNTVYTNFNTVAIDLPARGIGRLEGYWHTQGVEPGIYTATIILHYANKISQREFELEVYSNRIVTRGMRTGEAVSVPDELNLEKNAFLILIILALGVIVTVLVFRLRKRLPKDSDETTPVETIPSLQSKTVVQDTAAQDTADQIDQLQKQLDLIKEQSKLNQPQNKPEEDRTDKGDENG